MNQQSRIVKHIQELSTRDRERFLSFVEAAYFNQHEKTKELLEITLDYIERPNGQLERNSLFQRLFPGEKFDEQRLHNVMSYLKKLYTRFLAYQFMEDNPLQEQLFTLEAAYEGKQFDFMLNRAKQLEKNILQHPHQDATYHFINYRLHHLIGYYNSEYVDRSKTETFQKMINHLDRYYIIEKLRTSCDLVANMILFNTTYDLGFLEDLLGYVQKNWQQFESDTSILLYYTILMSLKDEKNAEHYAQLKYLLKTKAQELTTREGRDLFHFASNYCIRQINLRNSQYQRELFELYQSGLNTEMLLPNNTISEWDYKNITTLACSLKEFEWTEQFLENFKDRLPQHRRENAYNYNLANLYYNKKMYSQTLSVLLRVQFTDMVYHISTTFLLLRTYHALRDTEALLSLMDTFRIYVIRNKKLTTVEKKGYTNMLRFAKKMVLLKHNTSTFSKKIFVEKMNTLREKIEATQNIINKQWLLEECLV